MEDTVSCSGKTPRSVLTYCATLANSEQPSPGLLFLTCGGSSGQTRDDYFLRPETLLQLPLLGGALLSFAGFLLSQGDGVLTEPQKFLSSLWEKNHQLGSQDTFRKILYNDRMKTLESGLVL